MRLKLTILILAFLLAVPFVGTALAAQEQEQLVHQQFSTAYWSIWKHSNGNWQATGKPGDNKEHTYDYTIPGDKLKNYTLTRIEVVTGYDFDPAAYQQAGGWNGYPYKTYKELYLTHTPDNLTCISGGQDLATGTVTAKWSFTLGPTRPAVNKRKALDLKDDKNRHLVDFDEGQYANAVEGWLWFLPVHVKWYGIPKAKTGDFIDSGAQIYEKEVGDSLIYIYPLGIYDKVTTSVDDMSFDIVMGGFDVPSELWIWMTTPEYPIDLLSMKPEELRKQQPTEKVYLDPKETVTRTVNYSKINHGSNKARASIFWAAWKWDE